MVVHFGSSNLDPNWLPFWEESISWVSSYKGDKPNKDWNMAFFPRLICRAERPEVCLRRNTEARPWGFVLAAWWEEFWMLKYLSCVSTEELKNLFSHMWCLGVKSFSTENSQQFCSKLVSLKTGRTAAKAKRRGLAEDCIEMARFCRQILQTSSWLAQLSSYQL